MSYVPPNWDAVDFPVEAYTAVNWDAADFVLFPPAYLRVASGGDIIDLVTVAAGGGVSGMGGIPKIRKGASTYDIYLVETDDPDASPVRIKTTTGIKAIRRSEMIPSGLIAMWHGTIANIPSGWVICDGNNSTPNLLARFVQGVATAATNPGTTGGATAKTTSGHSHDLNENVASSGSNRWVESDVDKPGYLTSTTGAASNKLLMQRGITSGDPSNYWHHLKNTTTTKTDSISDIRPLYYDIAFIMKT